MRTHSNHKVLLTALLLLSFAVGCCDPGRNPNAGNPAAPQTLPTVILVTPPDGNVAVCPNIAIISATFSKAMNPATINSPASNFTLTDQSGASVAGTVTYVAATNIATFTPSSSLAPSAPYTATITTGAADTYGNTLAADFVWKFTTSALCSSPPPPLPPGAPPGSSPLGSACSFGILGATPSVTSTGLTTVSGDIGVWPAASITGFPPGTLTGTEYEGDAVAQTAQADLAKEYTYAAGQTATVILPADIGGLPYSFAPGIYKTTSAQPSLGITGNLTLDGGGDPNAVWIFQIVSSLTTAANNSKVILAGSAQSKNVFWVVGSAATLGTYTTFAGNIMAYASVTLDTGATLNGRAMSEQAAVILQSSTVNVPSCP